MEEILVLSELVELYRKGEIKAEGWYKVYPTELHKTNNSVGFIPGLEIENLARLSKSVDIDWNKFIWNHPSLDENNINWVATVGTNWNLFFRDDVKQWLLTYRPNDRERFITQSVDKEHLEELYKLLSDLFNNH